MSEKKIIEHSEETKKKRRKIEEFLRKTCPEEKIDAIAVLLDIDSKDKKD